MEHLRARSCSLWHPRYFILVGIKRKELLAEIWLLLENYVKGPMLILFSYSLNVNSRMGSIYSLLVLMIDPISVPSAIQHPGIQNREASLPP